jgi:hypothetical protein
MISRYYASIYRESYVNKTAGQETAPSYLLNRLLLWIESVIIEFRCVYYFDGFVKWRTIETFVSFTGCHTFRVNHLVGGYIIAHGVIYCCFWHGHVSFISLSQVDRFLPIDVINKKPYTLLRNGVSVISPDCPHAGFDGSVISNRYNSYAALLLIL